mmetsp:Transcript_3352/g.5064  ORF Transcript_3352/g.5064 Transcript_3352/m.5064 type:complete len:145 (-) Transcript_3352:1424-1858(-)
MYRSSLVRVLPIILRQNEIECIFDFMGKPENESGPSCSLIENILVDLPIYYDDQGFGLQFTNFHDALNPDFEMGSRIRDLIEARKIGLNHRNREAMSLLDWNYWVGQDSLEEEQRVDQVKIDYEKNLEKKRIGELSSLEDLDLS